MTDGDQAVRPFKEIEDLGHDRIPEGEFPGVTSIGRGPEGSAFPGGATGHEEPARRPNHGVHGSSRLGVETRIELAGRDRAGSAPRDTIDGSPGRRSVGFEASTLRADGNEARADGNDLLDQCLVKLGEGEPGGAIGRGPERRPVRFLLDCQKPVGQLHDLDEPPPYAETGAGPAGR